MYLIKYDNMRLTQNNKEEVQTANQKFKFLQIYKLSYFFEVFV